MGARLKPDKAGGIAGRLLPYRTEECLLFLYREDGIVAAMAEEDGNAVVEGR